jgi:acetyl esterase/lipase
VIARVILGLAALLTALAIIPMPTWFLWQLRYGALELRGVTLILGLAGAALGAAQGQRGLTAIGVSIVLMSANTVLSGLLLAQQRDIPLSALAYFTGGLPPRAAVEADVTLDPDQPEVRVDIRRAGPSWVLVVHGGAWQRGDKGEVPHVSDALAAAGYTVFDLRYRLAPEHPFPAALDDLRCTLVQLRAQAARLGIDPDRGALIGRSAGGQLVLLAAQEPSLPPACPGPPATVRAVASLYGPVDLAWGYHNPFFPDVIDGPLQLRIYLEGAPGARAAAYAAASPDQHVSAASPPTLLLHGLADRVVRYEHAFHMERRLREHQRPVEVVLIPGAEHGFDVRPGGIGEQIARAELLRFFHTHVRGGAD